MVERCHVDDIAQSSSPILEMTRRCKIIPQNLFEIISCIFTKIEMEMRHRCTHDGIPVLLFDAEAMVERWLFLDFTKSPEVWVLMVRRWANDVIKKRLFLKMCCKVVPKYTSMTSAVHQVKAQITALKKNKDLEPKKDIRFPLMASWWQLNE